MIVASKPNICSMLLDIGQSEVNHYRVVRMMHQALLNFTGGVHIHLKSQGPAGAFDAYRQIYAKGKNRSVHNLGDATQSNEARCSETLGGRGEQVVGLERP